MLNVKGVSYAYRGKKALDQVSFTLGEKKITALIGPDGAGKTTLLKVMAGLLRPSSGEVNGKDGMSLGYVSQFFGLYGEMSVQENLHFYGRLNGLTFRESTQRIEELLHWTGLESVIHREAGALSGGMKQKLSIAAAVLHRPDLLLLDEPTNGVDPVSRREMWRLLQSVAEGGTQIFAATQYLDEAAYCGRVILLHQGRILVEESPQQLLRDFPFRLLVIREAGHERVKWMDRIRKELTTGEVFSKGRDLYILHREGMSIQGRIKAILPSDKGLSLEEVEPGYEEVFTQRFQDADGGESR
ncbi:ABC-2 type transport system ATP-binding protein [Marininema mesophilum]|uniref:ABC-2 type transport system ATP-binding protein n=1 Tax=Marininema mesophilum TaxID=1048340 RepID=A0A1H2QVE2_9BACL|nr:ABC transporter ATP-binding protein [Marininema mesophilum]SDW11123.1 ABC-2 type transport system ATP-binding protein [Marininema mesophilum]